MTASDLVAGAPADPGEGVERQPVLEAGVGDGLLLVDPTRVRAHGLNASAAVVWRATAAGPTVAEVVDRVALATGRPAPEVDLDVRAALVTLAGEGVIALGTRPVPSPSAGGAPPGTFANVPATDEVVPAGFAAMDRLEPIGPFRGLDLLFDLRTDDPTLGRALADVWAPLRTDVDTDRVRPCHHYRIATDPDAPPGAHVRILALDGHVVSRSSSDSHTFAQAVWHANQLVSTASRRFLQLHSAGLAVDGAAVLLPAEMNSGKSTLATAVVEAGARYLTDETVAIDLSTAAVVAYPKAITLDPGSWARFADLEPAVVRDQPQLAHAKWYVHPDAIRPGAAVAPATAPDGNPAAELAVSTIVFPRYAPDRPTALSPLAPVEAAAALAGNAFNLVAIGQPAVDLVARLATSARCWSLTAADADSGAAAVLDAARRP